MNVQGTTRALDEARGAVRVEAVYDTDIDDVWAACTRPERLARWIAEVEGDPHEGTTVQAVFTSTWSGAVTIEACDAPHHLLLTMAAGTDEETQVEAWLTADGDGTRLVVEERGLPVASVHFYGAGWQAHLEDLGRLLASGGLVHAGGWSAEEAARDWRARWQELTPAYQDATTG